MNKSERIDHIDEWNAATSTAAKHRINKLIWRYCPDDMTLKEADVLACSVLDMIRAGRMT